MKILFISSNCIGDAVLTTSVLRWLAESYPTARFTVACGPIPAILFRGAPRLDKLIPLKKQKRHGHWIDLWKECIGTRWDLIVDLRNSAVTRLLFAKKKIYKLPRSTGNHKIDDHAKAMKVDTLPNPILWTDQEAEDNAAKLIQTDDAIIAFGPAANWPCKQWQIEKFVDVAKQMTVDNGIYPKAKILVTAAPHELDQVQPLIDAFPTDQIINIVGQDLLTVAACLKRCTAFVGNDSGLMHMAAATGIPTVGVFGPSYDSVYGPWGENGLAVRTPENRDELFARLPYKGANEPNLMQSLSVKTVMEKAVPFLAKKSQPFTCVKS